LTVGSAICRAAAISALDRPQATSSRIARSRSLRAASRESSTGASGSVLATWSSSRRVAAELEATRARGYALDDCESNIAVRCVAAPVIDGSGAAVAAISVSVPTVRWTAGTERQLANLVRRAGTRLSRRIGVRIDAGEVA
jgi:DNA-binding IclR family transcriptional regulator